MIARYIHTVLAVGATLQISTALMIADPKKGVDAISGYSLGQTALLIHMTMGLFVASVSLLILLYFLFSLRRKGNPQIKQKMQALFTPKCWRHAKSILLQLPLMLVGKMPLIHPGNSLALIVEALGIWLMGAIAATGLSIWFLWADLIGSPITPLTSFFIESHEIFANLLFAYLAGHILMAIAHTIAGHHVFSHISPFASQSEVDDR